MQEPLFGRGLVIWGEGRACALVNDMDGNGGVKLLKCHGPKSAPRDVWFRDRYRDRLRADLRLQLNIPIEPVVPGIVQVIGREAAAMFLQMPARRADRRDVERHMGLFGGAAALF